MKALIIDDARVNRIVLRAALKNLGYEVREAANGVEGLAELDREAPPDIVLVDWYMPEMDGLTFLRAVRAGRHADLPVVLVTAETDQAVIDQGLRAGANRLLGKPFTPEMVKVCLAELGLEAAHP